MKSGVGVPLLPADWGEIRPSGEIQEERQTEAERLQSTLPSLCSKSRVCLRGDHIGSLFSLLQKMIEEMTHRLVKLVRGALLPATLSQVELAQYGGWENKKELTGAWLTQIIHTVRSVLTVLHV